MLAHGVRLLQKGIAVDLEDADADLRDCGKESAGLARPGVQLLVVSAKYTVPALLNEKLGNKQYRDVYIDLNSASVPDSKVFIEDLGADGLHADRNENQPYDTYEIGGKRTAFDGDYKKQKLSKEEYQKVYGAADDRYSAMLQALLAQLKKTS